MISKRIIYITLIILNIFSSIYKCNAQDEKITNNEKRRMDLASTTYLKLSKALYEYGTPEEKVILGVYFSEKLPTNTIMKDPRGGLIIEKVLDDFLGVSLIEDIKTEFEYKTRDIAKLYFSEKKKIISDDNSETISNDNNKTERYDGENALINDIKESFISWSKKGEFEKTDAYLQRLNEQAIDVFDNKCYKLVLSKFYKPFSNGNSDLKLVGYDADKEIYSIKIDNKNNVPIVYKCSMPVQEAEQFGNIFKKLTDIYPLNLYIYNGVLCSNTLDLEFKYNYEKYVYYFKTDLDSNNINEIKISYTDLEYNNEQLDNIMGKHIFNYNNYEEDLLKYTDTLNRTATSIYNEISKNTKKDWFNYFASEVRDCLGKMEKPTFLEGKKYKGYYYWPFFDMDLIKSIQYLPYILEKNEYYEIMKILNIYNETYKSVKDYMTPKDPEFPGGTEALNKFLAENVVYPKKAQKKGIKGEVRIYFNIEYDGTLSAFYIGKSLSKECDEEALRVARLMPKWKPRMYEGKPERCKWKINIQF